MKYLLEYIETNRGGFIKPMSWLELRNILRGVEKWRKNYENI